MVALSACSSGGARRTPRLQALEACAGSVRKLADALGEPVDDLMRDPIGRRPWAAGLTCADLYREPTCAEAWRDAFGAALASDTASTPSTATTILEPCARAYCPRLTSAATACTRDGGDGGAAVAQLVELDAAILEHEGLSPGVARAIASRAKLFVPVSVSVDSPPAAPTVERRTLTIFVDDRGALRTSDGPTDLATLAPALRALAAEGGQLLLVAPPQLPKERIVSLLTALRAEGVTNVLFQVQPSP